MTEGWINELARTHARYFILPDRLGADATYDELEELRESLTTLLVSLIRTVAAEAREEGEREASKEAWQEVLDTLKQAWPEEVLGYDQSPCELIVQLINERDVTAEARKEGREEILSEARGLAKGYIVLLPRLEEAAKRLEEKGK